MAKCFLMGHGPCGGKITGEHYISETVLEAISPKGRVQILGFPWQKTQLQEVGIGSLVANILCEKHNSGLSTLDAAAGSFFRALDASDKRPASLAPTSSFDGASIERWLLKVVCGLSAGIGMNNGVVPAAWCTALVGGDWPRSWGLYLPVIKGPHVLVKEFFIEALINKETREVKGAKFRVAGVPITLLLGKPDNEAAWGHHRPRGLIFRLPAGEKRLELWKGGGNRAVIYSKVGSTKETPPQWQGLSQ